MTELTKALRKSGTQWQGGYIGGLLLQAAQEIERLHGDLKAEKALVDRLTNTHRNPPVPSVCKTVAGSCGCGGKCPPKDPLEQARESEATAEANALRAVRNQGTL